MKRSDKSNNVVFIGAKMIITTAILKEKYHDYANPLDKIKREVDKGNLIRLTNGIYETDKEMDPCLLASSILSPSYLSFDWALSYYGLIPEKVTSVTSATLGKRKNTDVPAEALPEGLTYLENMGYTVKVATKEKTICDSLCKWRVVRNIKELKELLFEDKRIDEDEFAACDFKLMKRLAGLYAKTNLKVLIKLIGNEYENEQHS